MRRSQDHEQIFFLPRRFFVRRETHRKSVNEKHSPGIDFLLTSPLADIPLYNEPINQQVVLLILLHPREHILKLIALFWIIRIYHELYRNINVIDL